MSELIPVLNLREEPSKDKEDRGYVIQSLLFHVFVDPLSEMSVSKIGAFGSTAFHIPRDEALYILLFVYTVRFAEYFSHVPFGMFSPQCPHTLRKTVFLRGNGSGSASSISVIISPSSFFRAKVGSSPSSSVAGAGLVA